MRLLHYVMALMLVLVWGFNFVVIKLGLEGLPPLMLVCARFFLTSIPAVFFIKRPKTPFKMVILYGLIMFAMQFSLLFLGISYGVAPGLAALILQLQVFFTIILGMLFFSEKMNLWRYLGAFISFCGIGFVALHLNGVVTLTGFLLVVATAIASACGNVISKKMGKINMVALVIWGSLVAWPPLFIVSACLEGVDRILESLVHMDMMTFGSILYITYLSTLFGYATWSYLLHHHSLSTMAPFTVLTPIVAMLSSVLILGETLYLWKIIAGILVVGGLCINIFGSRLIRKKREASNINIPPA